MFELDVLHVTDQTAKEGFITKKNIFEENGPDLMLFKWFFTPPLKSLQINCIWRGSLLEEVE